MRHIVWFSCGAASAVTAMLVCQDHQESILVRIHLGGEHEDNDRFAEDVSRWLNRPIILLKSEKYADHWEVIQKTRWVNGVGGARCTGELKKLVRHKFQQVDDHQYFGYTAEPRERKRAERFREIQPEVNAFFPLIDANLTKEQCVGILERIGVEPPKMYQLGFNNNNCIGCVKGGKGYWNKIREMFPEQFNRMALLEREVGASCIKGRFLDELQPSEGRHGEMEISCDFVCEIASQDIARKRKES